GGIALHFLDAGEPVGPLSFFDKRNELFENFASIAHQSSVHGHVLVDFGAIDFDVNLAGAFGVGTKIAGDTIIEAHAHSNQQIGFLNGMVDPGFAVHAHHAQIDRMI